LIDEPQTKSNKNATIELGFSVSQPDELNSQLS